MLIVLSPAKTLDYDSPLPPLQTTQPRLLEHSAQLVDHARQLSPARIASLMKVSDKLAHRNSKRFDDWHRPFSDDNARPAAFAFKGDVYTGMAIDRFSRADLQAAQKRLRILSGLYGVLRPLDLMQPYRLEMSIRLENKRGHNLYEFWGEIITDLLRQDLEAAGSDVLVNLASNEYFKSVHSNKLPGPIIEPVFQDQKNGRYKVISFYAKKARGRMAQWIVRQGAETPKDLEQFSEDGYRYDPESSTPRKPVFRRAE